MSDHLPPLYNSDVTPDCEYAEGISAGDYCTMTGTEYSEVWLPEHGVECYYKITLDENCVAIFEPAERVAPRPPTNLEVR